MARGQDVAGADEPIRCARCGAALADDAERCARCGAELTGADAAVFRPGAGRGVRMIAWGALAGVALLLAVGVVMLLRPVRGGEAVDVGPSRQTPAAGIARSSAAGTAAATGVGAATSQYERP